jgi:hypothetical protein
MTTGSPTPAPSPTCRVSPDPATVGGQYTVSGAGFPAGALTNIWVKDDHGTQVYLPAIEADGTFSVTGWASWPGPYEVQVFLLKDQGNHFALPKDPAATASFQVNPA